MFKRKFYIRLLLHLIIFIIFLPVILFFALQIKPIQEFTTEEITALVSDKLNTEVSLKRVVFDMPFDIVLIDLFVEDYQNDTLAFIDYLRVKPLLFRFNKNQLILSKIDIKGLRAEYRVDSIGYSNLKYLLSNLPPKDKKNDTSNSTFNLKINNINIENSTLYYATQVVDTASSFLDLDTIDVKKFNLKAKDFIYSADSIAVSLKRLNLIGKNGFRLRKLSTDFLMTDSCISISDFILKLNKSRVVINKSSLFFNSMSDLSEQIENVGAELEINQQTKIFFSDLGYFSKKIQNTDEALQFGITLSGQIGNLKANDFVIKVKSETYLQSDFELKGLPDVHNLNFDLELKNLHVLKDDISSIKNPLKNNQPILKLPESIEIPEILDITGGVMGTTKKFAFVGNIISSAGYIFSSLDFEFDKKYTRIAGDLQLQDFNLGYVLKKDILGELSLTDSLDVKFISGDSTTYQGYNNMHISKILFNKYLYNNITSKTNIYDSIIKTELTVLDTNLKIDFKGSLKLAGIDTELKFDLDLDTANLYPLNFIKDDEYAAMSLACEGDFTGNNLENISGDFQLNEPLNLIKNLQLLRVNEMLLYTRNNFTQVDTLKTFRIQSEFIDAYLHGDFKYSDLIDFADNVVAHYFPAIVNDSLLNKTIIAKEGVDNVNLDITIKDISSITEIFLPTVHVAENTTIKGFIKPYNKNLDLKISSDSLNISSNQISNLRISIIGDRDKLSANIKSDSIGVSAFVFEDFNLDILGGDNSAKLALSWDNNSELENHGLLRINTDMEKDVSGNVNYNIYLPGDTIVINSIKWIGESDNIYIDSTGIDIKNILIKSMFLLDSVNHEQSINIAGKISKNKTDTLHLSIKELDISQLNPVFEGVDLQGYMHSDITTSALLDTPKVIMNSHINEFSLNNVLLGDIVQTVNWIDKDNLLQTELLVQQVDDSHNVISKSLELSGDYNIETSSFDVDLDIKKLKFKPFAPYLDDYVMFSRNSNLNGNLKVKGDKLLYEVDGELNVFGAFKIPQTGVNYTINGGMKILLSEDKITIDSTVIVGPEMVGDALLYGNVTHKNFNDPYLNIYFRADTIAFLKLPRTNQSSYYGDIIASGDVELSGFVQNLNIIADITTEKNTDFKLLLDRPGEVANKTSIVSFVTVQDTVFVETEEENNSNIDIDLNLKLKSDAKFKVIFNELTGEALDIQGDGTVKVKKTALDEIVVLGKIVFSNGAYNFVLENIFKRKFEIKKGSSIVFNGDPLEGMLDISTFYKIKKANLYNLLLNEAYADQNVPVNCIISLKGQVLNPKIKFLVDLAGEDQRVAGQIKNLDDANMNKQFLSLLLFGTFQPLPGLTFDPNAKQNSNNFNSGLISNQLNALLSNINTDVDFDVNYVAGNDQTSDQIDVAFSIPLINHRVSINTDVGVGGNTNTSENQSSFIGDFEVDVKLNKKGNVQLKAFNKTNRNDFYDNGPYTQGVGIMYKTSFDKIFKRRKIKKDTILPSTDNTPIN